MKRLQKIKHNISYFWGLVWVFEKHPNMACVTIGRVWLILNYNRKLKHVPPLVQIKRLPYAIY